MCNFYITLFFLGFNTDLLRIYDRYDFHRGKFLADDALTLEKNNRAKSYDLESKWKQKLSGKIKHKNDILNDPSIDFFDY